MERYWEAGVSPGQGLRRERALGMERCTRAKGKWAPPSRAGVLGSLSVPSRERGLGAVRVPSPAESMYVCAHTLRARILAHTCMVHVDAYVQAAAGSEFQPRTGPFLPAASAWWAQAFTEVSLLCCCLHFLASLGLSTPPSEMGLPSEHGVGHSGNKTLKKQHEIRAARPMPPKLETSPPLHVC